MEPYPSLALNKTRGARCEVDAIGIELLHPRGEHAMQITTMNVEVRCAMHALVRVILVERHPMQDLTSIEAAELVGQGTDGRLLKLGP